MNESTMKMALSRNRKTVLLIDNDAHARAALRLTLEDAGFSVGEACTGQEGERTAQRIRPDAILAELLPYRQDSQETLAEHLKSNGSRIPFYIVSNAADALIGSVGLTELGITGVFLKPVDTAVVIQTLLTRFPIIKEPLVKEPLVKELFVKEPTDKKPITK